MSLRLHSGGTVQGTAAFSKFVAVLQAIADSSEPLDMGRLCALLPYPRPTLYRIVSALIAEGLVAEARTHGTLQLGARLISFAAKAWDGYDLRRIVHEHLVALRDATEETVHLAVPSGLEMVYIDKLESPHTVRMSSRIGTRVHLHSTSVGKAYLAALDPAARKRILDALPLVPRTENTIVERRRLEDDVEKTRNQGFSEDQEEHELEIKCLGAAILDRNGEPVACVSISIPKYRFDAANVAKYRDELLSAITEMSRNVANAV